MATWPGRKMRDRDEPYLVYRDNGWTWKVLKIWSSPEKQMEDPTIERWFCDVSSPYLPGGEMGDTYIADIFEKAPGLVYIDDEFEDDLSDQGYGTYLEWLRVASLRELGEEIYPSGFEEEWEEEMGYPLTEYERSLLSEIAPDDPRFRLNPSEEQKAAINRIAKELGKDPDVIEYVEKVESSVPVTKGHYGKYMRLITELAGDQGELFAMAVAGGLKNAGANPEGVNSALRVMYGGR